MKIEIIESGDGSHTLYVPELDETYHSRHGAVAESKHVFVESGLRYYAQKNSKKPLKILEVGMGTGLNVLLTIKEAQGLKLEVEYTTLEKYPLEEALTDKLNYPELDDEQGYRQYFEEIHRCQWETEILMAENFKLTKIEQGLLEFSKKGFDLIYYDAFAPSKQPELWTLETLEHVASLCNPEAVLVTYCSKGQVRRDLISVGFEMEKIPGPPGKREMLRGTFKK